jgi:glycosyltransferase involved in cell wall biosynthesis
MNKLRIGVVVYHNTHETEGGGHSYYHKLLSHINEHTFSDQVEIVNVVLYSRKVPATNFTKRSIFLKLAWGVSLKSLFKKTTRFLAGTDTKSSNAFYRFFASAIFSHNNTRVQKILAQNKIDLLYYLKPEYNVFEYPFIATNWDVAHKSILTFPEISSKMIFKDRENYYRYTLSKAFSIFCESEAGAKELKKYYPVCESKVKILPTFAGNVINMLTNEQGQAEVLERYKLIKRKFFFYPAQMWAHKNHYNLILAFQQLSAQLREPELKLVLTGSDKGNKKYILETINDLGLNKQVILTGFVPENEICTFYKNAIALVMPTFLGPTNLPLLEAAHLGCPVICSNFEGHRELLKDTALYVDPSSVTAIADAMQHLLNPEQNQHYASRAKEHILQSPFRIEHSLCRLNSLFIEMIPIRKAWGVDFKVIN